MARTSTMTGCRLLLWCMYQQMSWLANGATHEKILNTFSRSLTPNDSFSKIGFSLLQHRNSLSTSSESGASLVEPSPSDTSRSPFHAPPRQPDSAFAKSTTKSSPDPTLALEPHVELNIEPSYELYSESPAGPSLKKVPESSSPADFEVPSPEPATSKETTPSPSSCDPLNWFGILVPSALRRTQSSFKAVVEEIVPLIVTVDREMNEVEIEVRRMRKKLLQAEKRAAKAVATEG